MEHNTESVNTHLVCSVSYKSNFPQMNTHEIPKIKCIRISKVFNKLSGINRMVLF